MESNRQSDMLPLDVVRLCVLLARILCRCAVERDPDVLALLSTAAPEVKKGANDGSAA